jgi:hypothetical protein
MKPANQSSRNAKRISDILIRAEPLFKGTGFYTVYLVSVFVLSLFLSSTGSVQPILEAMGISQTQAEVEQIAPGDHLE